MGDAAWRGGEPHLLRPERRQAIHEAVDSRLRVASFGKCVFDLQLICFRAHLTFEAIRRVCVFGVITIIFPLLFLSLIASGNLSAMAYCKFYAAWDSTTNSIRSRAVTSLRWSRVPVGWIGVYVMWTVGGYLSASDAMRPEGAGATAAPEGSSGGEQGAER